MKKSTLDWLNSARNDLDTIDAIRDRPQLTPVIAFHAQQCVEKCLNKLYLDSRYPGEFGLLPTGAPTLEDADQLADFAYETITKTTKLLQGH